MLTSAAWRRNFCLVPIVHSTLFEEGEYNIGERQIMSMFLPAVYSCSDIISYTLGRHHTRLVLTSLKRMRYSLY